MIWRALPFNCIVRKTYEVIGTPKSVFKHDENVATESTPVTPVGISASQNRRKRFFKACKLNITDYNRTSGAQSERIQKKKKTHTHTHAHYPLVDMLLNDVTTYLSSMIWGSYDLSFSTYLESAYWKRFQWVAFPDISYCRSRISPTPCTLTKSRRDLAMFFFPVLDVTRHQLIVRVW